MPEHHFCKIKIFYGEMQIFTFKFKKLNWKENWSRFVFVMIAVLALIFLKFLTLPFIILAYVCFSLLMRRELIE